MTAAHFLCVCEKCGMYLKRSKKIIKKNHRTILRIFYMKELYLERYLKEAKLIHQLPKILSRYI